MASRLGLGSGLMDEEIKAKVLEKWKNKAMEWHKKELAEEGLSIDASEDNSANQELTMVRELKRAVLESNLDRKSIYLTALATPEHMLERGKTPQNLPEVVRSLLRKSELKDKVLEITKKYKVNGKSYFYLWGLDDERASGLY
jgi:hypothetical protein